jgi:hypothetical protein
MSSGSTIELEEVDVLVIVNCKRNQGFTDWSIPDNIIKIIIITFLQPMYL